MFGLTPWVRDAGDGEVTWEDVLHEGWADIIGLIVEWAAEGSQGDGMSLDPDEFDRVEHADWFAGEDVLRAPLISNEDADRRWDDYDDGANVGYSLHGLDEVGPPPEGLAEYAYFESNRLPLAFRLSVTGGRNPVCNRNVDVRRYWTGCEVGLFSPQFCAENPYFCPPEPGAPPGSVGSDFSVVGRPVEEMSNAFFRALRLYWMHMDSDLGDVADFVKVAAHDLYYMDGTSWPPVCTDGFDQQIAVAGAFRSVGYEGTGGWVCTCSSPCSPPVVW